MKKLLIFTLLLLNLTVNAQKIFTFGEKEAFLISTTLDPNASIKEKGLNFAFDAEYTSFIYTKLGTEFFPALTGGYNEIRWSIGPNFTTGLEEEIRYYVGVRTGLVFRENQGGYIGNRINYGIEAGIEYTINNHYVIGIVGTAIKRYDQEILGWNPELKFSGGVKFAYKWYYKKHYN